jgi:hypothetical protein
LDQTPSFDPPRSFLFVSAYDPEAAVTAVREWADGPPDVCMRSPSTAAHETAARACPDGVPVFEEALLAGRFADEDAADYAARTETALRLLNALETRSALVVWDELRSPGGMPFVVTGDELVSAADAIDRDLPAPF